MVDPDKLKVVEAHQDDVNKGIVRIDSSYMRSIGVTAGDIVLIKGERDTLAIVDRSYPSDLGLKIIRMDGTIRKNAKVSVGELIRIEKADVKEAKKIILVPMQDFILHPTTLNSLKKGLYKKPVCEGDIITVSGNSQEKKQSFSSKNPFAIDLFNAIERDFLGFNMGSMKFKVQTAKPEGFLYIGPDTVIEISKKTLEEDAANDISYEDIGGLKSQLTKIRELVELPLKHPEIFNRLGINPPKGILLYGPPGTGKTLLARAIAAETEANFFSINAPEIVNKYYGESEKKLRELFDKAEKESPSVVFIDEIDAIAAKRDEVQGETEKRIVAQLLTLMDGLKKNQNMILIAATNRPDAIDEALRRPGRFDRELEIGVPKQEDRFEILKIHTRGMPVKGGIYKFIIRNNLKKNKGKLIKRLKASIKKLESESSADKRKELAGLKKELTEIEELKETLFTNKKAMIELSRRIFELYNKDVKKFSKYLENRKESGEIDEVDKLIEVLNEKRIISRNFYNTCASNEKAVDKLLQEIGSTTHGFVGADLEALVKEAAYNVLRRNFPEMDFGKDNKLDPKILAKLEIKKEDFVEALKLVRPSAMREFLVEVPNVRWSQIGGLEELKQSMTEMIEWPLKNPKAFARLGIEPPKGILLYGPPGTGKTLLAKAVATETQSNFIYIKGPEILGKYLGESEKAVRKLFEKARQNSPTILFFDEFDAIASTRLGGNKGKSTDSIVNQILTEMDGIENLINVKVIAATNRPGLIDPALLRPGRFDKLVLVDVPDLEARKAIFDIYLKKTPVENKETMVEKLALKTEGYVGADIEALVREAGLIALRRDVTCDVVAEKDFDKALTVIRPSINPELQKQYQQIESEMKNPKKELETLSMSSYM